MNYQSFHSPSLRCWCNKFSKIAPFSRCHSTNTTTLTSCCSSQLSFSFVWQLLSSSGGWCSGDQRNTSPQDHFAILLKINLSGAVAGRRANQRLIDLPVRAIFRWNIFSHKWIQFLAIRRFPESTAVCLHYSLCLRGFDRFKKSQ